VLLLRKPIGPLKLRDPLVSLLMPPNGLLKLKLVPLIGLKMYLLLLHLLGTKFLSFILFQKPIMVMI
jgi:hypothetical protein